MTHSPNTEAIRLPVTPTQTKYHGKHGAWNRRHRDGKHKPKATK